MITPNTIQQITNRIDIIDVVGEFVKLKKRGTNYLGLCPFHGEKSPSFTVSPSKQFYHCFGCGKSGNAIGFLMEHLGMNFPDAVKDLAQQYGLQVPEEDISPAEKLRQSQAREQQSSLNDLLAAARRDPGGITFGSPGIGTDDHLLMVLMQQATGVSFNHVAFQGDPQIRTAILGKQIVTTGLNLGYVLSNLDGMRLLAVAANERSRFAPDLPTTKELGIDVTMASERGLVMPVGTPAHIVSRFREATDDIAKDPEFIRAIEARSLLVRHESGEAWFTRLRADERRYRALWQSTPWAQR
jgi:hypothetical protein